MELLKYYMDAWQQNEQIFLEEANRLINKHGLFRNCSLMDHQK